MRNKTAIFIGKVNKKICQTDAQLQAKIYLIFYQPLPLQIAARQNNLAMAQLLIERIDDKNPKDIYGKTPLHDAAFSGNFEVFKLIFDSIDQEKNPVDKIWNSTPLHEAASGAICRMKSRIAGENIISCKHQQICKLIIENNKVKSPLDIMDVLGRTPFQCAIDNGHSSVIEFFSKR